MRERPSEPSDLRVTVIPGVGGTYTITVASPATDPCGRGEPRRSALEGSTVQVAQTRRSLVVGFEGVEYTGELSATTIQDSHVDPGTGRTDVLSIEFNFNFTRVGLTASLEALLAPGDRAPTGWRSSAPASCPRNPDGETYRARASPQGSDRILIRPRRGRRILRSAHLPGEAAVPTGGPDTSQLLRALRFSADKHRHQRRKDAGASPYINHPIEVASVLADVGGVTDVTTLMGAILHDTIEDTQTTPEELEAEFGPEVRQLVAELTDDKKLRRAERKRLQIVHAPGLSLRAKLVKLGDKICNVRDVTHSPPAEWSLERRQEYLDWTEEVVAGCRGTNEALERHYDRLLAEGRVELGTRDRQS